MTWSHRCFIVAAMGQSPHLAVLLSASLAAACGPPCGATPSAGAAENGPKPPREGPWTQPFGVFYAGHQAAALDELGVAWRVFVPQHAWEGPGGPLAFDEMLLEGHSEGVIATLQLHTARARRPGVEEVGYHRYCLPQGEDLARGMEFVGRVVERYDGDLDSGCTLPAPDCWTGGDGLAPSDPAALLAHPVHLWQAENEFFSFSLDCSRKRAGEKVGAARATAYLRQVGEAVRAADPQATLILPSIAGVEVLLFEGGYADTVDLGATDCTWRHLTRAQVDADPKAWEEPRSQVRESRERIEQVLRGTADLYDAVDFHAYRNDVRVGEEVARWMEAIGLGDHARLSTELAGPYFMFPETGAPPPRRCARQGRDDRGPERYDEAVLSEHLVKKVVLSLASGMVRVHWATGEELFEPYIDNYQRLGLIEKDGRRKPAYHAYKDLIHHLSGYRSVESPGPNLHVFRFVDRPPVGVAWAEGDSTSVDLRAVLGTDQVVVHPIVSRLGPDLAPVVPAPWTVAAAAVPLSRLPVFVQPVGP